VQNDRACEAFHALISNHEKLVNANTIIFIWQSFERDTNMGYEHRVGSVGESHQFQITLGFIFVWAGIIILHEPISANITLTTVIEFDREDTNKTSM